MKVFIAWSGKRSQLAARVIHDWLPEVIQAIQPFMSTEEIRKGSTWLNEIITNLEECHFGIICITSESLNSNWIHFEAGALAARIDERLVTPLLIGVVDSDLQSPLSRFQNTKIEKDDLWRLVKDLNRTLADQQLDEALLRKFFDRSWDDLIAKLEPLKTQGSDEGATPPKRTVEEILEEVLESSREQRRTIGEISTQLSYATPKFLTPTVIPAGEAPPNGFFVSRPLFYPNPSIFANPPASGLSTNDDQGS